MQESNNWCSQLQATAEGSSAGRLWSKKGLPGPERLGHGPPPISFTHAVFSKANSWLNLFKNCPALLTQCIKCDWACGKEAQCYMVSEVGSCTASLSPSPASLSPTLPHSLAPTILSPSQLCVPSFHSQSTQLSARLVDTWIMQHLSNCSSMVKATSRHSLNQQSDQQPPAFFVNSKKSQSLFPKNATI